VKLNNTKTTGYNITKTVEYKPMERRDSEPDTVARSNRAWRMLKQPAQPKPACFMMMIVMVMMTTKKDNKKKANKLLANISCLFES
jgi:hypothetical protein